MPPTKRKQGGSLICIVAASVLATLDLFIVNLSFPSISARFASTGPGLLSWVLNAYTVVFAAFLIPADRLGWRRLFTVGLVTLDIGAVASTIAPHVGLLIAGRAA